MPFMTQVGDIPTQSTKSAVMARFRGVDLTGDVTTMDASRSPAAPNMMPDDQGFPAKRPGYRTRLQLTGRVHGAWTLKTDGARKQVIHAGTTLYAVEQTEGGETATPLYTDMNDAPGAAVQLGGKLWIADGKRYLYYDGEQAAPVSQIATVPVITIAKGPNGKTGATSYKAINLLTGKQTESYLGEKDTVDYYLSLQDLTDTPVTAQVLDAGGNWQDKTETTDFTVDRTLGKVTFKTAPGESPVEGEDNVRITYEVERDAGEVDRCCRAILYGVNGAMDRIFLTGDPQQPNVDHWSEWSDPAYIGDTNYGLLGSEGSPIRGYSVLNGALVAHKDGEENGRNIFIREGQLDEDGTAVFRITDILQGEGAVSGRAFGSIASEPLYLTRLGVAALTPTTVTGERTAQVRSYYLNGALRKEPLSDAPAAVWGRFYVLAGADWLYLLDSQQKQYEKNEPTSGYQMEGYYWTGIGATALWEEDGALCFGTKDGCVRQFSDGNTAGDYNDCDTAGDETGRPVQAAWATPLLNLGSWANLKNVTGVWVVLQPFARSGGEIYYATDKEYEKFARSANVDIFDWNDIDFQRFTFNTLDRPMVVNTRKKAKKVKLFQVIVKNGRAAEPFGLFAIQVHYKMGGKVKR